MRWERATSVQTSPDEMQGHGALWYTILGLGALHVLHFGLFYIIPRWIAHMGSENVLQPKKQMEKSSFTVQVDS